MKHDDKPLSELKGLGPKSIRCLNEIGIHTRADLEQTGPVNAYVKLQQQCTIMKPSLNLLYGMVGALQDVHWTEIAKHERIRLLMELEDCKDYRIPE